MKLIKTVTGRALRRTFQDLTRAAEVDAVVAKAISGHATDAMRVHYSTASDAEMQAGIAKVIDLAGVRDARDELTDHVRAAPNDERNQGSTPNRGGGSGGG